MPKAKIVLSAELIGLLPKRDRGKVVEVVFKGNQSVKHIIESLGIPHTEIGLLKTNQQSVGFNYLVESGDIIVAHDASPENDSLSGLFNEGKLTLEPRFILDNHLGKLAAYLRMLGFDAIYRNDFQDDELASAAVNLDRILLSRDRQLLMRKTIRYGYLIRSLQPKKQVLELFNRFDLAAHVAPFHRCLRCNSPLEPVQKQSILHRLQPKTKKYFQEFQICPLCQRVYWKGSHYERMEQVITSLIAVSKDDKDLST